MANIRKMKDASSTPSIAGYPPGRWFFGAVVTLIFLALLWGSLESRFVPTQQGDFVAFAVSVTMAVLAGLFAWKGYAFSAENPRFQQRVEKFPGLAKPSTRILGLAAVAFIFTFPATERGFLDWWTAATGLGGEQVAHLSRYSPSSRRTCAGFDVREAPFLLGRAVCTRLDGATTPEAGAPVKLYGTASRFGIVVSRYQIDVLH
jgi:hypothetical protein